VAKGLTSSPIEMLLNKEAVWEEAPKTEDNGSGLPYATHSGIWNFMGQDIRVYRLSNGKAIIDADDFWKLLGVTDETPSKDK
jgi:hypothetical protein